MKNNSIGALFIRMVIYSLVLLGILEVIKYDSTVGEMGARFGESSFTEIAQEVFLILAAIFSYFTAWRSKKYRALLIALGTFTLVSFVREFNNYMNTHWFRHSWQIIVYAILIPFFVYAFRNWRAIKKDIEDLAPTFSFGVLFVSVLIVFLFSRIYGLHEVWQNLLGDNYIRDIKNVSEEGIELLGYSLLFLGALEVCVLSMLGKTKETV